LKEDYFKWTNKNRKREDKHKRSRGEEKGREMYEKRRTKKIVGNMHKGL
jgi:hypothetical protein